MSKRNSRLQVWQSSHNRRWYWRLVAGNGRVAAVGGEQFPSWFNANRAAVKLFPGVKVEKLGLRRFPIATAPKAKPAAAATGKIVELSGTARRVTSSFPGPAPVDDENADRVAQNSTTGEGEEAHE